MARKSWCRFISKLAGFLLSLLLLASLLGLGEMWFWFCDLWANFRMQFLLAAVVLLAVFIGLRQWREAAVALCLLVLNGWFVADIMLQSRAIEVAGPAESHFRLIQFNINRHNRQIESLAATLKASGADIIVLQELTPEANQLLEVALRQSYPYRLLQPLPHAFGMGLFSRWPLEALQRWSPVGIDAASFRVQMVVPGMGQLTLAAIHPYPPMNGAMAHQRNDEIMQAASWLAGQAGPRILIGDMNLTPYSVWFRKLMASSGLKPVRSLIPFAHATWPDSYLLLPLKIPIDHILISDDLAFTRWQAGFGHGSDHAMVVSDIIKQGVR